MLVVVFKWGVGDDVAGLYRFGQVEGWIPIFLFAMLFGLSMDYEVFLVTRMREAWDDGADNATAVAYGLERTGRIITAAAVIMCAAFLGFVAGRIVGLQEFGLGLAVAILVDATIVRSLLVPSMMRLFDRWNWWLPALGGADRPRRALAARAAAAADARAAPIAARADVAVRRARGSPRAPDLGARSRSGPAAGDRRRDRELGRQGDQRSRSSASGRSSSSTPRRSSCRSASSAARSRRSRPGTRAATSPITSAAGPCC